MNVSFNGFGEAIVTMEADGTLEKGAVVMMSANGRVKACTASAAPVGVVCEARSGLAAVQLEGYVTLAYTGDMALGWQTLLGDGAGAVKTGSGGRAALVLNIDTAAKTCGVML